MSMNSLAIPEMIQLSSPLLTNGARQHQVLTSVPSTLALLPVVQAAHDGLLALAGVSDVDLLTDELRAAVGEHDRLVRRIDLRLGAEIATAEDPADRAALERALEEILPTGQALIRESDAAKAGERELRARRVTPASLAVLATVPLRGAGTLADTYAALQAASRRAGEVEAQRALRLAELAGPRVREARKRWVAAIEVVDQAMRAAGLDPTPVLGAVRAAQKRSAADSEPADPQPAPSAPPAPPPEAIPPAS